MNVLTFIFWLKVHCHSVLWKIPPFFKCVDMVKSMLYVELIEFLQCVIVAERFDEFETSILIILQGKFFKAMPVYWNWFTGKMKSWLRHD